MPDKMNLDYLKLLYCEFQKYEVMTMSVVGDQPNKKCKSLIITSSYFIKGGGIKDQNKALTL